MKLGRQSFLNEALCNEYIVFRLKIRLTMTSILNAKWGLTQCQNSLVWGVLANLMHPGPRKGGGAESKDQSSSHAEVFWSEKPTRQWERNTNAALGTIKLKQHTRNNYSILSYTNCKNYENIWMLNTPSKFSFF